MIHSFISSLWAKFPSLAWSKIPKRANYSKSSKIGLTAIECTAYPTENDLTVQITCNTLRLKTKGCTITTTASAKNIWALALPQRFSVQNFYPSLNLWKAGQKLARFILNNSMSLKLNGRHLSLFNLLIQKLLEVVLILEHLVFFFRFSRFSSEKLLHSRHGLSKLISWFIFAKNSDQIEMFWTVSKFVTQVRQIVCVEKIVY